MTHTHRTSSCLSDADLAQLCQESATSTPASPARSPLELHLENCVHCQQRLELLSGLKSLETVSPHLSTTSDWSSDAHSQLNLLISLLQAHPPSQTNSHTPIPHHEEDSDLFDPCTEPGPQALGMFGGYRMLERIASGGMGLVYRAWDPSLGRIVALKILRPALAASPEARTRFSREARAAAAVVHDHVVAIHAVGEERGLPYLVMALVKGKSLEQRLHSGPISFEQVLRIGAQTARGLAAAHAADDTRLTKEGMMAGTPEFMAPEQVRGESVTAAADQFSLGCVLFACIHGQSPFHTESTLATLRKIVDQTTPSLLPNPHPFAPWLNSVLQRLLAKDPALRFPNASDVASELESGLQKLQTRQPPPGSLPGPPPPRPPRRVLTAAVLLLFLLTSTTLIVLFKTAHPPNTARAFTIPATTLKPSSTFHTIEEATSAAEDGDVIEIATNTDIILQSALKLGKRRLTLRAQPGFHPVLTSTNLLFALIVSEGQLKLEGLELRGPGKGSNQIFPGEGEQIPLKSSIAAQRGELPHRLVIVIGGSLHARYCRFVAPVSPETFQDCLGLESCPLVTLEHCEFYNAGGGVLTWRFRNQNLEPAAPTGTIHPQVHFNHCFAFGKEGFLIAPNSVDKVLWSINQSTVIGVNLMRLIGKSEHHFGITNSILALKGSVGNVPRNWTWSEWVSGSFSSNLFLGSPANGSFRLLTQMDPTSLGPIPFDSTWQTIGERLHRTHKPPLRPHDYMPLPSEIQDWPINAVEALRAKGAPLQKIGPGQPWADAAPRPPSPPPKKG